MLKLGHLVAQKQGPRLKRRHARRLRAIKPDRKDELFYKSQLLELVRRLDAFAQKELIPELRRLETYRNMTRDSMVRDMDISGEVKRYIERMARSFGDIGGMASRLAQAAVARSQEAVDSKLVAAIKASVGIDVRGFLTRSGPIQNAVQAYTKTNIDLITSIPKQYFEKLENSIVKNMEAGMRFENLVDEVKRIGNVAESRATLIARDQTSKMNGAFNEVRQRSLGIDSYEWQTSGDERVREEHVHNDGKVFRWDSPPPTGHPGEDIQCRCVAIPIFNLDEEEARLSKESEESERPEVVNQPVIPQNVNPPVDPAILTEAQKAILDPTSAAFGGRPPQVRELRSVYHSTSPENAQKILNGSLRSLAEVNPGFADEVYGKTDAGTWVYAGLNKEASMLNALNTDITIIMNAEPYAARAVVQPLQEGGIAMFKNNLPADSIKAIVVNTPSPEADKVLKAWEAYKRKMQGG